MRIGYGRVSKESQNLDLQSYALQQYGCERIYLEKRSGKTLKGPELLKALRRLKPGDELVFWMIDRIGRNARDLINLGYDLGDKGIAIKSLTQDFDTTTLEGQCEFIDECNRAQKELARISRRTKAGLDVARQKGSIFGRPPRMEFEQIEQARLLRYEQAMPYAKIAEAIDIPQATVWRTLKAFQSNKMKGITNGNGTPHMHTLPGSSSGGSSPAC